VKQITIIETRNGFYVSDGRGNAYVAGTEEARDKCIRQLFEEPPAEETEPSLHCPQCDNWFSRIQVSGGAAPALRKQLAEIKDKHQQTAHNEGPLADEDVNWLILAMEQILESLND
jgi:hypothetical protein